nr:armadillo repeat-containing protein LFR-like [Ipomoea batatas]
MKIINYRALVDGHCPQLLEIADNVDVENLEDTNEVILGYTVFKRYADRRSHPLRTSPSLSSVAAVVFSVLQSPFSQAARPSPSCLRSLSHTALAGRRRRTASPQGLQSPFAQVARPSPSCLRSLSHTALAGRRSGRPPALCRRVFGRLRKPPSPVAVRTEDGLFNLDEEGRAEKQLCAVAASNIIRNFSFMPDNEVIMAQHRHCLETLFMCLEDYVTEDEELVTNALETMVNLAHLLDLRIFTSSKPTFHPMTEKRAVLAIRGLLGSAVKAWHCAASELIGRLIINPDNEPFLLPFAAQIYKRLVDIMGLPTPEAQAAAVGALYNLTEVNMDCRQKLASERWAIDRLLKVIKSPHPVPEICRKAALVLESLVSEPQNKTLLLVYENAFAEMLFGESKYSDIFARILYELTSHPTLDSPANYTSLNMPAYS